MKRGRPSASERVAIEQAILEAARDQFLAPGYKQTQMEAVARQAQVAKATLYARFPTKDALLRAVVVEQLKRLQNHADLPARIARADLGARLRWHAAHQIRSLLSAEVRELVQLTREVSSPLPAELRALVYESSYRRVVRHIIEDIRECPGMDEAQAQFVAETLMSSVVGWCMTESMDRVVAYDEAIAWSDRLVDLLVASARRAEAVGA